MPLIKPLSFLVILLWNTCAFAYLYNPPEPNAPCPANSVGVTNSGGGTCTDNTDDYFMYGAGASYTAGITSGTLHGGFGGKYVPFSGEYTYRVHMCPATEKGLCFMNKSTQYIDGKIKYFFQASKILTPKAQMPVVPVNRLQSVSVLPNVLP